MIRSRCLCSLIVTCTVLFPMATPALAQGERRFYLGAELGTLLSSAVTMTGDSNDRASICDEFINPLYASVPGCTDAARAAAPSLATLRPARRLHPVLAALGTNRL